MSGPVSTVDAPASRADTGHPTAPCVEVGDSREAHVGRMRVRRALPRRGRRTVGAWCFADHMGPADVTGNSGPDIGPHPHIGLQTVTWLIDGQALHRDSLGSEQVIKPGELNLMTAGDAVSHAEEATGHYRGVLEGIQLWMALPEETRHGPAAFEHHAELPRGDLDGAVATVLIGEFGGLDSPARHDTPLMGADLSLHGSTTVPLRTDFEYALVVLEGEAAVHGEPLRPGRIGYLGRGRDELRIGVRETTRALLIGGEPFEEPIVMWWNFVGRTRDEIDAAYASWSRRDDRFGRVRSSLPLIPAEAPFWQRPAEGRRTRRASRARSGASRPPAASRTRPPGPGARHRPIRRGRRCGSGCGRRASWADARTRAAGTVRGPGLPGAPGPPGTRTPGTRPWPLRACGRRRPRG